MEEKNRPIAPIEISSFSEEEEQAIAVRSHSALNDLGRSDSRKQGVRGIELKGSLYAPKKSKGVILTGQTQIIFESEEMGGIKMSAKTDRTLTALMSFIPIDGYYGVNEVVRVETTVQDMKSLYGLKDAKTTRESLDEDLSNLASITIQREDAEGDLKIGLPIVGDVWGRKRSKIFFSFSPSFIRLLASNEGFTLNLPPELFKVNMHRNPHAWTIGKKLINHSNANLGKKNEGVLSVKALLDYVESLPSEEEVSSTNRNYTDRIIAPMEKDLNALVEMGVLEYWDYCHSKGEPLEDAEQAARLDANGNERPLDFQIAKSLYVTWKLKREYGRLEAIEAREKSHAKKLAAREEAEERRRKSKERQAKARDKRIGEAMAKAKLEEAEGNAGNL